MIFLGIIIIGMTNAGNIQSGGYNYEQLGVSTKMANRLTKSLQNGMGFRSLGQTINSVGLLSGATQNSKFNGLEMSAQPSGPLSAAVHTKRFYQVIPIQSSHEPAIPQVIEVGPTLQPVHFIFRSVSSPVLVQQIHTPGSPGQTESTHSEDEPHRVLHEVVRPVIQEVREVIQPYRRVTQEVRPVLEEVHTIVAKGDISKSLRAPAISADNEDLKLNFKSEQGLLLLSEKTAESDLALSDAYSSEGLNTSHSEGLSLDYSSKSAKKSSK